MEDEVKIEATEDGMTATFGENGMTAGQLAKWAWPAPGTAEFLAAMLCARLSGNSFVRSRAMIEAMAVMAEDQDLDMALRELAFKKLCEASEFLDGNLQP